jgi:hypothetical protein
MPYDRFFFDWYGGAASELRAQSGPARELYLRSDFARLRADLLQRAPAAAHSLGEPYFQRSEPCSLVIEEVERVWRAIDEHDDWSLFSQKISDIRELGALSS